MTPYLARNTKINIQGVVELKLPYIEELMASTGQSGPRPHNNDVNLEQAKGGDFRNYISLLKSKNPQIQKDMQQPPPVQNNYDQTILRNPYYD